VTLRDGGVSQPRSVVVSAVSPAPSDEELVAIVAALELAWPRPVIVEAPALPSAAGAWRWSGRWWAKSPIPASRRRP
jgi:hypothetical protein